MYSSRNVESDDVSVGTSVLLGRACSLITPIAGGDLGLSGLPRMSEDDLFTVPRENSEPVRQLRPMSRFCEWSCL